MACQAALRGTKTEQKARGDMTWHVTQAAREEGVLSPLFHRHSKVAHYTYPAWPVQAIIIVGQDGALWGLSLSSRTQGQAQGGTAEAKAVLGEAQQCFTVLRGRVPWTHPLHSTRPWMEPPNCLVVLVCSRHSTGIAEPLVEPLQGAVMLRRSIFRSAHTAP